MKKLFVMAVAVAALCLTACGGQKGQTTEQPTDAVDSIELASATAELDSILTDAIEAKKDTSAISQAFAAIQEKIAAYLADNKAELAEALKTKVQEFVNTKADAIKAIAGGEAALTALTSGIESISTTPAEAAVEAAGEAVDAAKEAAGEAVDNAKEAVSDAANEAVDNAKEKVDNAKEAVKDAANNAKEDAKAAAGKAVDNAAAGAKKALGI